MLNCLCFSLISTTYIHISVILTLVTNLIHFRNEVGEKNDISLTMTIFTSPISAKLASRAGFEVLSEKLRHELVDVNGQLLVPTCTTESFKCMAKKLN